jgi:phage baseplate assembly protein W
VAAIEKWEPRVRVRGARIQRFSSPDQSGNNVMLIKVKYDIVTNGNSPSDVLATGLETSVVV